MTKRQIATKLLFTFNSENLTKLDLLNITLLTNKEFKYYFKNNMPKLEQHVIKNNKDLQKFYKI